MCLCKTNICKTIREISNGVGVQTHLDLACSSGNGHGRSVKHFHTPIFGVMKYPILIFRVLSQLSEDGAPSRGEPTKQLITVNGTMNG
jgi:hypothetical protein